jgi:short-subunit dehydrogenase
MTIEENLRTLQPNLIAPLALSHAVLPGMLRRGCGHIVNISAMAGRVPFPYTEVYAAAKDGLIGFTRVLRSDYHACGISASVLILGAIRANPDGQIGETLQAIVLSHTGTLEQQPASKQRQPHSRRQFTMV